ncbi:MAG: copper homeostasis protein CutC [Propionibacteriaceae bacterium]
MTSLLEVVALTAVDAKAAADGGAHRLLVLRNQDDEVGLSPTPDQVEQICAATSLPVRVMVRLREGFSTDGGEFVRLQGLISAYLSAGAEGMTLGFLNGYDEIDDRTCAELVAGGHWPWTFHRAIDYTLDLGKAWSAVTQLPRLETVMSAGSSRGVSYGLDELIARTSANSQIASLVMVSGGLAAEHVPWLVKAGVRKFHIGQSARPRGDWKDRVDATLVKSWRQLIDTEIRHEQKRQHSIDQSNTFLNTEQ